MTAQQEGEVKMLIKGIYNTAICFCDEMETEAEAQIRAVRRR